MKNVIIYSRVSTDDQAEGFSLDYQEDSMRRYCQNKGYRIIKAYREDHSAKSFDRPKWNEIKAFLKLKDRQPVDTILFLRWDRFSRNLLHSLNEINSLKKIGVEIETVETQFDTSTPEAALIQAINLVLPQIENEKISRRSLQGSHKARLLGWFTGIAPVGYKNIRVMEDSNTPVEQKITDDVHTNYKLKKHTKSTLAFDENAPLIRGAFEKMASGIYGADEIRRWLNKEGVKIGKNQFLNVIRNVTYTGKIYVKPFMDNPAEIVPGHHPALISDEVFAAANDVLKGRRRKMKFNEEKSDLYPLKGFLKCPEHGRTYTAYGAKGRNAIYHYYLCSWKGGNHCPRYPIDWAHKQIEKILETIQISAKAVRLYRAVLSTVFDRQLVDRKKSIQQIQNKLENLNLRKKRIQDDYMDGNLSSKEYQEMKMQIDTQVHDLNSEVKNLPEEGSLFKEYLDKCVPMLEDLVGFYRKSSGEVKKKILSCIFSKKFHFENGQVAAVDYTGPIQALLAIGRCKKEKEIISDLLAPPAGLEPATL